VWDIAAWLPLITIGDILGVLPPDRDQLPEWSVDMLRGLGGAEEFLVKAMTAFVGYARVRHQDH
jgi:cytochrome P450 family 142 subfamily A polypeptide 1